MYIHTTAEEATVEAKGGILNPKKRIRLDSSCLTFDCSKVILLYFCLRELKKLLNIEGCAINNLSYVAAFKVLRAKINKENLRFFLHSI